MCKNNCRDGNTLKVCSSLQLSCNLTGKCNAVGYYSYTDRYMAYTCNNKQNDSSLKENKNGKNIIISIIFHLDN